MNGSAGPDHRARLERARAEAADAGLDGLWIGPGPNFRWLTGESAHPGGWPLWLSAVLVPTEGEPALIVSEMHARIFDLERCPVSSVFTYVDGDDPSSPLRRALAATGLAGSATVGGEDALWFGDVDLVRTSAPALRLQRTTRVFNRLRAVKDEWEIEQLRRAAVAHDAGYARAVEVVREGVTVARAGARIVEAMLDAGSEELAISGAFHRLTDRCFAASEIVDVDLFPGSHGGYRADTARNIFLGDLSPEARRLYEATVEAYAAAVGAVRPGATAESVHAACADAMRDAGYEQVWKVGHGVGLADAHEPPLLQPGNTDPIEEGMVFTIDPGAFIARDTPVHIEDTVVVTATGCVALNAFTHELQVV